jgi:hypothetical protein
MNDDSANGVPPTTLPAVAKRQRKPPVDPLDALLINETPEIVAMCSPAVKKGGKNKQKVCVCVCVGICV